MSTTRLPDPEFDASGISDSSREGDPNFVTALARGLELLRAFRPGDTLLGNQEFVRRTGFPKATVSRLAGTLVSLGYLRYDEALGVCLPCVERRDSARAAAYERVCTEARRVDFARQA